MLVHGVKFDSAMGYDRDYRLANAPFGGVSPMSIWGVLQLVLTLGSQLPR